MDNYFNEVRTRGKISKRRYKEMVEVFSEFPKFINKVKRSRIYNEYVNEALSRIPNRKHSMSICQEITLGSVLWSIKELLKERGEIRKAKRIEQLTIEMNKFNFRFYNIDGKRSMMSITLDVYVEPAMGYYMGYNVIDVYLIYSRLDKHNFMLTFRNFNSFDKYLSLAINNYKILCPRSEDEYIREA